MSKIKNTAEVSTYNEPSVPNIRVNSHWNRDEMVVVVIGENKYEVLGRDLKRAIDNCMNVGF